jgi:hypothetical protein
MPPTTDVVNYEEAEDRLTPRVRQTLPPWLLKLADDTDEKIWDMPHSELTQAAREILENELGKGSSTLRVRMAFWNEYERAQGTREGFQLYNVIGALCSQGRFRKIMQSQPTLTAWLLTPPNSYNVRLLELSMLGEERMKEILTAEAVKPDGKVDSRLAMVQVKLWEVLQDRIYGAVMQKTETKNLNLNAEITPGQQSSQEIAGMSLEEINARLNALQAKMKALTSPAPIRVDVLPEDTKKR